MISHTNDAVRCSPASSQLERAEQALMWAMWALMCDQAGHGGVLDACQDIYPEFNINEFKKRGFPTNWPDSYDQE